MKKTMLVENKYFKKTKPSKEFKRWYKKTYGLDAKELYLATDEYYNLLDELLIPKKSLHKP